MKNIPIDRLLRPETPEELFYSLFCVEKDGNVTKPFAGWNQKEGWRDALLRFRHFVSAMAGRASLHPLNGNAASSSGATINSQSGRALIERVINAIDAMIEMMALQDPSPLPKTPKEASARYFGLNERSLAYEMSDDEIMTLAERCVLFRAFIKNDPDDNQDAIYDIRDYGIGLTPEEMPHTILSVNAGNKRRKPYLTGKHGHGAANTLPFSKLTLIASKKKGSQRVGLTIVLADWDKDAEGVEDRNPTFKYLTLDDTVMSVEVSDEDFPHGTIVRHVGYFNDYAGHQGEDSIFGLCQRMLVDATLPVLTSIHKGMESRKAKENKPPYYGHRHVAKGTRNMLHGAYYYTLNGFPKKAHNRGKILHAKTENFLLGQYDFGDLDGPTDLGSVNFTTYVLDTMTVGTKGDPPKPRTPNDAVKNFADPYYPIQYVLDGQNHGEAPKAMITSAKFGAGYSAIGPYIVVIIDCNKLSNRAKHLLFSATRERLKDTFLKDRIEDELRRILKQDQRLQELEAAQANTSAKPVVNKEREALFSDVMKKHFRALNLDFEAYMQKGIESVDGQFDGMLPVTTEVTTTGVERLPRGPKELPPIPKKNPPDMIAWPINNDLTREMGVPTVRMYPGQNYSWRFETNAPDEYWHNSGQAPESQIEISTTGPIYFKGGEETMTGGRVKCRFECLETAKVGQKAVIHADLRYSPTAAPIRASLHVIVAEQQEPRKRASGTECNGGRDVKLTEDKTTKTQGTKHPPVRARLGEGPVEVTMPFLPPIPVLRTNAEWHTALHWPDDEKAVGFSLRKQQGKYHLYYNAELPRFLECKKQLDKSGLGDKYVQCFEVKLLTHVVLALNNEMLEEESLPSEEQVRRLRAYLAAVAETIALDARETVLLMQEKSRLDKKLAAEIAA